MLPPEQRARVRALNDALRQDFTGGRLQLTQGVLALPDPALVEAMLALATFADFSPGNDPYEEHDFGAFHVAGQQLFFQIDYYAPGFEEASPDPSDEAVCVRVLTLMLAEEY